MAIQLTLRESQIEIQIDFSVRVTLKFDGWPQKTKLCQALCIISNPLVNSNCYSPAKDKFGSKLAIFCPVNLKFDEWVTLENNRAPLLYYTKHCASFQMHWCHQTWVTVRKCSIRVKIGDFLSRMTLKFDGWPWKTIGHLFYTTLRFVHHFKAVGEFKLELQSGNAQFGSKSAIFCPVWPWNLTDDLDKQ